MRSSAATYAPRGLRINCVAPGLVATMRQTAKFVDNEKVKVGAASGVCWMACSHFTPLFRPMHTPLPPLPPPLILHPNPTSNIPALTRFIPIPPTTKDASESMHPSKHLVSPDDVAAAVQFLLGARSVTGQVLAVDGGLTTLAPHAAQEYGV
jgi:NAD(P)-dependent dehydrogenase (short-subunit alcohol dehydrogenase family)